MEKQRYIYFVFVNERANKIYFDSNRTQNPMRMTKKKRRKRRRPRLTRKEEQPLMPPKKMTRKNNRIPR